jgi:hypothetical protein
MKKLCTLIMVLLYGSLFYCSHLSAQKSTVSTDSLVDQFIEAWNSENIEQMAALLDPNAFFKSPFQLRYTRDTMVATVLVTNPPVFKVVKQTETHSFVEENMAWSIGHMVSDVYDQDGNKEEEQWPNDYVFLFIKKEEQWKLIMLIFHE